MILRHIIFFPPKGNPNSPYDYITGLEKQGERANILHRLNFMRQTDVVDWPHGWIHKISSKIYQLTSGLHRIMYILDGSTVVVLHACRKVKRKTHIKDIQIAESHYSRYLKVEGKRDE